ncbi:hypothetical protein THRCLA_07633 [Thraustotheca clavata]|uniref:Secreted protein n=1 Tax=Thraustotheca clavata TaxID=74557 RepID=A0A0A7CM33_9STRA|nr:secreted protein [Thraustotheca clavata]OQR95710.1 hypothetical protein THRCLA_07633 [Thraustotheca clavata]
MWRLLIFWAVLTSAKRCPGGDNQCNLHGSCMINRLGDYVCNCQWGYTGSDCSQKLCPHGFDPATIGNKQNKKLRLQVLKSSSVPVTGNLLLNFHGHVVEMNLDSGTSEHCSLVFRRFHNLGESSCVRTATTGANLLYEFDVELISFPIYPVMNNIFYHDGNPLSNEFTCDTSQLSHPTAISCTFTSLTDSNVKAYLPCSNHGLCNGRTGLCSCEQGFHGVHCGHNRDDADILQGMAPGPFYSGNLLHLAATRGPDASFNLMQVDVAGAPIFTMNGNGKTTLHQGSFQAETIRARHVEVHEDLSLHSANFMVHDGSINLKTSSFQKTLFALDASIPSSQMTCAVDELADIARISFQEKSLLSLSATGRLSVGNVSISESLIVHESTKLHGSVAIGGATTINDGLIVQRNGIEVQNGGLIVDGAVDIKSTEKDIAFKISASNAQTALQLDQTSPAATFLKCNVDNSAVFSIGATGATTIHSGGLKVESGAIDVVAGGQTIQSGGLSILSGGLLVASGTARFESNVEFSHNLKVNGTENSQPALNVHALHPHFASSVVHLDASAVTSSSSPGFDLLTASTSKDNKVFAIDGQGNIATKGQIGTSNGGHIRASGPLIAETQALFRPSRIVAKKQLTIPCTHSYVQVLSDGESFRENVQTIDTTNATYGQLLVVQNSDEDALSSLKIPPRSSALFIFDGQVWQTLTATEFDTTQLSNVKEFTAAGDLNIGDVQFTAQSIQVGSQKAGGVAWYGKGGVLRGDNSFTYDDSNKMLSTHQLKVNQLVGKIDMTNSELRSVEIVGGQLRGINMSALTLEVAGEMYVESNAFVGGWLTVDGQVMGSGSYVDSSDARFKTNITALKEPLEAIKALNGVEYRYRTEEFPEKHFTSEREIGFIAQEVEAILPQVVTTDANGYKYVAYSRVLPVAVEAIKEQSRVIQDLQDQIHRLQQQIDALVSLKLSS